MLRSRIELKITVSIVISKAPRQYIYTLNKFILHSRDITTNLLHRNCYNKIDFLPQILKEFAKKNHTKHRFSFMEYLTCSNIDAFFVSS